MFRQNSLKKCARESKNMQFGILVSGICVTKNEDEIL